MSRIERKAGRWKTQFERGFTMIELMVSLAVFSVFMVASAQFWGTAVHGGFQEQRQITDLNQIARLALEFVSSEIHKAGAGQLFAPRLPNTSPGFAIIPLPVATEENYKPDAGSYPAGSTGDGGISDADQLTVVYGTDGRVARVVWDDLDATLRLDFQLRDDTQDAAAGSPNPNPYPFFTGFFNPAQPGPYSPGSYDPLNEVWPGGLLLVKTPDGAGSQALDTFGEKGRRAHFRMVRVTSIKPVPFSKNARYQADVTYKLEPENPFNRWLQTVKDITAGDLILYFDDPAARNMKFYQARIADSVGGNIESPGANHMMGCARRDSSIAPIRACSEAMLVQMRTFYIAQPGSPANPVTASNQNPLPALAMIPYGRNTNYDLAQDSIILAEGIEDLQFEYFFGRGIKTIDATELNPQNDQGVHNLLIADPNSGYQGLYKDSALTTHYLTGTRISMRAVMDVGKQFYSIQDAPLANRTDYSINADPPDHPRLRRVMRQFVAFRNVDTPYAPPEEGSIVVF